MLSLVIAESALEIIPKSISGHPSVTALAHRFGNDPKLMLLDKSWHYGAMENFDDKAKRGRPDLIHLCLLTACATPLYQQDKLQVYVHTIQDKVITLGKQVRLPRSYYRFCKLFESLFHDGASTTKDGTTLLQIEPMDIGSLIDSIHPTLTIGLSTLGTSSSYENTASEMSDTSETCLVIGGFQNGHFSDHTTEHIDKLVSIDDGSQDAHVIMGRILYEYEKTIFI